MVVDGGSGGVAAEGLFDSNQTKKRLSPSGNEASLRAVTRFALL